MNLRSGLLPQSSKNVCISLTKWKYKLRQDCLCLDRDSGEHGIWTHDLRRRNNIWPPILAIELMRGLFLVLLNYWIRYAVKLAILYLAQIWPQNAFWPQRPLTFGGPDGPLAVNENFHKFGIKYLLRKWIRRKVKTMSLSQDTIKNVMNKKEP